MKEKNPRILICTAKVLVFLILFFCLYFVSRDILRDKRGGEALYKVFRQPNNSYDVVLAGPSHMQHALHPAQLFGEYGIVSCNTGTSAQSIPSTYYVVKEMIERHDPELVVLDLFCIFYPEPYFAPQSFHLVIDNFPLSRNKIDAINNLVPGDKTEFLLNYTLYHGRWQMLSRQDLSIFTGYNETFQPLEGLMVYNDPFQPVPPEETAEIPELPLTYLKKIVDLCKETNTELLLTVIPYRADIDNNDTSALLQQKMFNTVEKLAQEWDVDYFNGLHHLDEIGFDFTTDLIEYSHVSYTGGYRLSRFYGQYITDNYQLPNRSEDPKYSHWHRDYSDYLNVVTPYLADSVEP